MTRLILGREDVEDGELDKVSDDEDDVSVPTNSLRLCLRT